MAIEIKMPALSPTMEEGTLAKWLVKEGDIVRSGDLLAEIETDKATMEFEAVDEGTVGKIMVAEGAENVKVGTVIATLVGEGEEAGAAPEPKPADKAESKAEAPAKEEPKKEEPKEEEPKKEEPAAEPAPARAEAASPPPSVASSGDDRVKMSPLAKRLAQQQGIDLSGLSGSGPGGRIVKADLEGAGAGASKSAPATQAPSAAPAKAPAAASPTDYPTPHEVVKLSGMRKTIARRLTESKQTVPHIYLTVDVRLDALLKLRGELNAALSSRGVKLSVNDLLIKALGIALVQVPECNVQFRGDDMLKFSRADISVAVSIPGGLITPIVTEADSRSITAISTQMKDFGERAKAGKLLPEEYQGGTASLSNMGMMGITQFDAVINPPQGMILAVAAGEKRPWVMPDDTLGVATAMFATGSFDHRAIDGADGARLMGAFKDLVEKPLGLVA